MNKKKNLILLMSSGLVFGALASFILLNKGDNDNLFKAKAGEAPYSITITDVSSFAANPVVKTKNGNSITFNTDALVEDYLASGESIYNVTPISGITSVSITTNDTELEVIPASKNASDNSMLYDEANATIGSGYVEADLEAFHSEHVVIKAQDSCHISSIVIEYSCSSSESYDVTLNIKFGKTQSTAIYALSDVNHQKANEELITGISPWDEMTWNNTLDCYSKTYSGLKFSEFRFQFATVNGDNYFVSYDYEFKPYRTFITESVTFYCTVYSFPMTSDYTTTFEVSTTPYETEAKTIKIYAANDFHGYVDPSSKNAGIEVFGTYFKQKGEEENTLLLDQGDTWQGEYNSSVNKGKLVTDVYNAAHFDARTIGNHDFDWGVDVLKENNARSYEGYTVPALGCNIYQYDKANNRISANYASDIAQKSKIVTLENGLKVGIVGAIGKNQITSINSQIVDEIGFKEHIHYIKEEARELRHNGCDIVICSIHADQDDVKNHDLCEYVDLVLCAHTHQQEISYESYEMYSKEGRLYYAQFGRNGECAGEITLTYDPNFKYVTYTSIHNVYPDEMNTFLDKDSSGEVEISEIDGDIHNLYQSYVNAQAAAGEEIMHLNPVSSLSSKSHLPNLECKAIYERAIEEYPAYKDDIVYAYANVTRENASGQIKYKDVYSQIPFENHCYVVETTGEELLDQARYNELYIAPDYIGATINLNDTYKVVVPDYLLFHISVDTEGNNRAYNYFPYGATHILGELSKDAREILADYFRNNGYQTGENSLTKEELETSLPCFSASSLEGDETVSVTYRVNKDGDISDTVVNVPYNGLYTKYCPADPVWEGHEFTGWYFANGDSVEGAYAYKNITIHAKFDSADVITVNTEEYLKHLEGNGTVINVPFKDSSLDLYGNYITYADGSYITMGHTDVVDERSSILIQAPSGYKITKLVALVSGSYININFFSSTAMSYRYYWSKTTSGGKARGTITPNNSTVFVINDSNYAQNVYEFEITLEAI